MSSDAVTAERIAKNQSVFRDANERIHDVALLHALPAEAFPVICECADPACREILRLSVAAYDEARANPRRFLAIPGHEAADQGASRVVAERDGYVLVEKTGRAGEVAEELARGQVEEARRAE